MKERKSVARRWVAGTVAALAMLASQMARAHCDTMDGPVVVDAKAALGRGDVTPVLKWISKEQEPAIRKAFQKTLAVREKGEDVREVADLYFFETLVKIHRAGEGAPYTGLKPAGTDPGPAITAADRALERGSVDEALKLVLEEVEKGIRSRFEQAYEAKQRASHSVSAGRAFVKAYVEFMHYVERLYDDATRSAGHEVHIAPKESHGMPMAGHDRHEAPLHEQHEMH